MTEPREIDIEDPNPNPDEVTDDGLGIPEPPEDVTDVEVDEDDPGDPSVADPTDHVDHREGEPE